ncbi:nickel ABC transporter permease subunit NikB [Larsenimonas rhizosphaerae]|uniref:nickel ABC transporter permease subunit NikB n=1 Tax=Larsenimonas rhizosphaerae TaxID=2944682 RepID=UPI0020336E69|nr:nickel ABC transporter permease subunit NikB [Larsenimonas rhizosphaerae]MCM2129560.1 nickel ABC transporter permease subunit NikB [Larsenimonas rhizosphaerae]
MTEPVRRFEPLWQLALRRLALLPILLLLVSVIIFVLLHVGRGDPAMDYLRLSGITPTDQALMEARHRLGLDLPLVQQYGRWLWGALHLDFGTSFISGEPVLAMLLDYLPATLSLVAVALVVTAIFSVALGLLAGSYPDRWPDHLVRFIAFLGVSMPNFWLGFLMVLLFSVWLEWLPPMGYGGPLHFVMPAMAISLMTISINARMLRTSLLEARTQRHVHYARLRGLSSGRQLRAHVLPHALLPLLTASGMAIGELIGGAFVIENIFAWPGVGRLAVEAIHNRDFPVLQCFTLLMTLVYVLANLGVDVVHAWLDPRIRRHRVTPSGDMT